MRFLPSLLTFAVCALLGASANAATYTVNSTADVDGSCSTTCTLRQAINSANDAAGGGTIIFDPTTFASKQTIALNGTRLPNVQAITITGPSVGVTIDAQNKSQIFNLGSASSSLTLSNCSLVNGSIVGAAGGGIYNGGHLTLTNCTLAGNTADLGGGIYNAGFLTLTNCTLAGNTSAREGGGVYNNGFLGGTATLTNCTVSGNTGRTFGGGIINRQSFSIPDNLTLDNCIVAGNISRDPSDRDISGTVSGGDYNLVQYPRGATLSGTHNIIDQDPQLGPLQDNGGATPTQALMMSSPAINAGNSTLTTDQRGYMRPVGSGPDIGAFEVQNVAPVVKSLSLTPDDPRTNDVLTTNVSAAAVAGGNLSYAYTWMRSGAVLPNEHGATLNLGIVGNGSVGDTITVTVVASDGSNSSAPKSASTTVANSPVTLTGLNIKSAIPNTLSVLQADVQSSDADGGRPTYTFVWSRIHAGQTAIVQTADGTASQNRLDLSKAGYGDKGDTLSLTVTAEDGRGSTSSLTKAAKVINTVPSIANLTLSPSNPTRTSRVTVSASGNDPDAMDGVDTLSYTYKWRVGTRFLPAETGSTLDLSKYTFVKAGDKVSVEARAGDGSALSAAKTASVTVTATTNSPTKNSAGNA